MSKALAFEATPFKTVGSTRAIKNKVENNVLDKVGTGQIVWHLVKRHKFGLVTTYAIILTSVWMFPPLPDVVLGLFGR